MQRPSLQTLAAHNEVARVGPPSLDPSALLDRDLDGWRLTLYPQAGEGTLLYLKEASGLSGGLELEQPARDPALVEADSAQRAKGEIRRQIRANRGRYLWTFTYAEATYDYAQLVKDVGQFLRRLKKALGKVWLILVPEPHPGGHGYHLHGATNQRLPHAVVKKCWGHGFVWVGDHQRKHKQMRSRHLARYLAKYATKMVGGADLHGCRPRDRGSHRYWVTQGFEPEKVTGVFPSLAHAKAWLYAHVGQLGEWHRLDVPADVPIEGWWLSWDDRWLAPPPGA